MAQKTLLATNNKLQKLGLYNNIRRSTNDDLAATGNGFDNVIADIKDSLIGVTWGLLIHQLLIRYYYFMFADEILPGGIRISFIMDVRCME